MSIAQILENGCPDAYVALSWGRTLAFLAIRLISRFAGVKMGAEMLAVVLANWITGNTLTSASEGCQVANP